MWEREALRIPQNVCSRALSSAAKRYPAGRLHEAGLHDKAAGIMARREFSPESQNQAFPEASDRHRALFRAGRRSGRLCRGLRCVPLSGLYESPALWTSHRDALLRGAAEKWQDPIHLQSAGGANLRPRVVSPRRIRALLVFAAAYRATHRHLEILFCRPAASNQ